MAKKILTVATDTYGYLLEENVPEDWKPYCAPEVKRDDLHYAIEKLCKASGIKLSEITHTRFIIDIREVK